MRHLLLLTSGPEVQPRSSRGCDAENEIAILCFLCICDIQGRCTGLLPKVNGEYGRDPDGLVLVVHTLLDAVRRAFRSHDEALPRRIGASGAW